MTANKPVKAIKLVVEALGHLRNQQGFTSKEILRLIETKYGINTRIEKCVMTALKRGTEYGILQEDQGRYTLKVTQALPLLAQRLKKDKDFDDDGCKKRRHRSRRSRKRSSCRNRKRSRRRKSCRSCGRSSRRRRHSRRRRSRRRRAKCRC